jgi:hypothetical protein
LVDDPYLYQFASSADSHAFAEHFGCSDENACVFDNLSGSATLVAPKPPIILGEEDVNSYKYGHIAAFVRTAPTNQIVQVWRLVAQTFQEQLLKQKDRTVWFSTAGTGIAWLHFRLDDRPKYYLYRPFKREM